MSISALELRLGMHVFGADGRHVGQVKQIRAGDFLVDRSFQRDVFVPLVAIQRIASEEHAPTLYVVLDVPAHAAGRLGWVQSASLRRAPLASGRTNAA
jgi:hypothetical protein